MKTYSKKIIFNAWREDATTNEIAPNAAIKTMPDWYKQLSPFIGKERKFRFVGVHNPNTTVKWCSPFMDAMTAGYMITLAADVMVQQNPDGQTPSLFWHHGGEKFISTHSLDQVSHVQIPDEYWKLPYKFENHWGTQLPLGYSAIFTHPMNRTDLPFYTLSGVVDIDTYLQPVNFPFLLRKDFEGIIPAGTPIVQIIPFRREPWKFEIKGFNRQLVNTFEAKFNTLLYRVYKKMHWKKKIYQ